MTTETVEIGLILASFSNNFTEIETTNQSVELSKIEAIDLAHAILEYYDASNQSKNDGRYHQTSFSR